MNIFGKIKQKRNLKKNQADTIFKGKEGGKEKIKKYQLIDGYFGDSPFDTINEHCICPLIGRENILHTMQVCVLAYGKAPEYCENIDIITSPGRDYYVMIGTLQQFYVMLMGLIRSNSDNAHLITFLEMVMMKYRFLFSGENGNRISYLIDPFKEIPVIDYTDSEVTYFRQGISDNTFINMVFDIDKDKSRIKDMLPFVNVVTYLNENTVLFSIKKRDYYIYKGVNKGFRVSRNEEAVEVIENRVENGYVSETKEEENQESLSGISDDTPAIP